MPPKKAPPPVKKRLTLPEKLRQYNQEKAKLFQALVRRENHNNGKPVLPTTAEKTMQDIYKTRKSMDIIVDSMREKPAFEHNDDDACFAEIERGRATRKGAQSRSAAQRNIRSSALASASIALVKPSGRASHSSQKNVRSTNKDGSHDLDALNYGQSPTATSAISAAYNGFPSPPPDTISEQSYAQRPAPFCPAINNLIIIDNDFQNTMDVDKSPVRVYPKLLPNPYVSSGYPRFDDGEVVIILSHHDLNYQYQLHEDRLRYFSPQFDVELNQRKPEPDPVFRALLTDATKRFSLIFNKHLEKWSLIRTSFTMELRETDTWSSMDEKLSKRQEAPAELFEAYDSLFMIFYHLSPNINTNDMETALAQSYRLLALGSEYQCTEVVEDALQQTFESLGDILFREILEDAPRWLHLGWYMKSTFLVQEALIHIVGLLPEWPWSTPEQNMIPELRQLFSKKAPELMGKVVNCILSLTNNVVELTVTDKEDTIHHVPHLSDEIPSETEHWLVSSLWQSWFNEQRRVCPPENYGSLFREIAAKPEAYLPEAEVRIMLGRFKGVGFGDFEKLVEDLESLKNFAQKHAYDVAKNESRIPDLGKYGITWLTSTTLSESELPWGPRE